jgi:AcrR family transcriptional regulator
MTNSVGVIKSRCVERAVVGARQRAADRAQLLIDATTQLIAERGDADITLSEVLTRTGLSQRTLYHYFENKQELLVAFCASRLHHTALGIHGDLAREVDPLARLEVAAGRLFDVYRADRSSDASLLDVVALQLFLSNPSGFRVAWEPLTTIFEQLLAELAAGESSNGALAPRSAAIMVMQAVMTAARLIDADVRHPDQVAHTVKTQVWLWCTRGFAA